MAAVRRTGIAVAVLAAAIVIKLLVTGGHAARPSTPASTPAPQPSPASSGLQLGANVGPLFNGRPYRAAVIAAQLAALRATGANLARADAFWEMSEPSPPADGVHHYDWRFDDLIAAALAAHGLRWLPIIDYSAPWAQLVPHQAHSPPASAADYAAYAAALASRYGAGGSFWRSNPSLPPTPTDTYEVWNEPDSAVFWFPKPDAASFAALYLRARAAIRTVQPNSRVLVGGLTRPTSFLPAMLAAAPNLRQQLDGVAIHPYGATPQAVLDKVRGARATLVSLGLGRVPLYVTEFGWSTSPPGGFGYLTERLRPTYIEQALTELGHLDCGVAAVLLYAWITPQTNPSDTNDWFGINPPAGGGSSDVRAFAQGLRDARATAPPISC
jgi:hypothetical protein